MNIGRVEQLAKLFPERQGIWKVYFQEAFHRNGDYWPLCTVEFDLLADLPKDDLVTPEISNAYSIRSDIFELAENSTSTSGAQTSISKVLATAVERSFEGTTINATRVLPTTARELQSSLISALVRVGLLRPVIDDDSLSDLTRAHGAILIPDTNSAINGTLHYMCRHFGNHIGYVALPEDVEHELRNKSTDFKDTVDDLLKKRREAGSDEIVPFPVDNPAKPKGWSNIFKLRAFAQSAINALRTGTLPVELELLPIQASSLKSAGGDEEIIRTVAEFLRTRHLTAKPFFLTHDYNMARFCDIRGLRVIFCKQPSLRPGDIAYSIRYDYRSRRVILTDIADLIWELAHSFNSIRMVSENTGAIIEIHSHLDGVSYANWAARRMHFSIKQEVPQKKASEQLLGESPAAPSRVYGIGLQTFLTGVYRLYMNEVDTSLEGWAASLAVSKEVVRDGFCLGERLGLWTFTGSGVVPDSSQLEVFVTGWRLEGSRYLTDRLLHSYGPFASFVQVLRQKGSLAIDRQAARPHPGINSRAIKYFPKACELLGIGRVIKGELIWTGETIDVNSFREALIKAYQHLRRDRDFIGLHEVINYLYRECHISHEAFGVRLEELLRMEPDLFETSGAIALPASRENAFDVLIWPIDSSLVKHVKLEDGIVIGSQTIKAIFLRRGNV